MTTIFKIERVKNGYLVEYRDESVVDKVVYTDRDTDRENELESWKDFLYTLTEIYGPMPDKYGLHNISIDIRPGSKRDAIDDIRWFLQDVYYITDEKELNAKATKIERVINDFEPRQMGSEIHTESEG